MKRSFSQTGFAALGLIALAGAVVSAVYFSKPNKAGALFQPDNASVVAQGKEIYAANCASCHGDNLEGQPNWRSPDADGYLPAPPHDKSGHTWHHPDEALFGLTKLGVVKYANLKDHKSNMPAYEDILSDDEIIAVLSYIKSTWPKDIREMHDQRNAIAAQRKKG